MPELSPSAPSPAASTPAQSSIAPSLPPQPSTVLPTVDPRLLEILVCPVTRGPLRWDPSAQELVSDQAGLAYKVRDGIPIMLPDEARPLDD